MKEVLIILILILPVVFAAPTVPPPPISGDVQDTSQQTETTFEQNAEPTETAEVAPQTTQETTNTEPTNTESYMKTILIISIINSALIFILILSAAIHILKDRHPYLAFKFKKAPVEYKNELDAKQYTEIYKKISSYIRTNLRYYPYDVIKQALRKQGFTSEEIDAVYYEVQHDS